jgi:hypothetical protein
MINPSAVAGLNLTFDAKNTKLTKFDVGTTIEPAERLYAGLRHEFSAENKLSLGKTFLLFYHQASAIQTIGSEFTLTHKDNSVGARFGLTHAFSPDFTGKFKVDHGGKLDAVLKLKMNESLTAAFTTGIDLKSIANEKIRPLPIGLSFDLKL